MRWPRLSKATSALAIARWLGPWSNAEGPVAGPPAVLVDAGGVRARVYAPSGRPRATTVVAPGLHFSGPDDVRMERLCGALAAAGRTVVAPYIEDYQRLLVSAESVAGFATAIAWALDQPFGRAGAVDLFSISFGSLLALRAGASPLGDRLRTIVVFGGYADWVRTVRFAITGVDGEDRLPEHDPLNLPALAINLAPAVPEFTTPGWAGPADVDPRVVALRAAWLEYCRGTWGRAELKVGRAFVPAAMAAAEKLPMEMRASFLAGCGVRPDAIDLFGQALGARDWSVVDVRDDIRHVRCRVVGFHGRNDDVIPSSQLDRLVALLPASRNGGAYKTGLYAHTGTGARPSVRDLGREVATMARMMWELAC